MNKLLTYAGTMPVYLGDVDFMQDAAGAAFTQLARALMNSGSNSLNAILQGVEITEITGGIHYSAGIVVLNGEILPVAEGTATIERVGQPYFHVVSELSSERTFKNGETHNCHDTRSAEISGVAAGGIAVADVPRLIHRPADKTHGVASTTGQIETASLYRRNGLWFVEVQFEFSAGGRYGIAAHAIFSGLTAEELDSIESQTLSCVIFSNDDSLYAHATCSISKDLVNSTVDVYIKKDAELVIDADVTGYVKVMFFPA